jgi:hypothetical protein
MQYLSKSKGFYLFLCFILPLFVIPILLAFIFWVCSFPDIVSNTSGGFGVWLLMLPVGIIYSLLDPSWAFVSMPFGFFESLGLYVGWRPPVAPWHVYPNSAGWYLIISFDTVLWLLALFLFLSLAGRSYAAMTRKRLIGGRVFYNVSI